MAEDDASERTLGFEFPLNLTDHGSVLQFRQRYALAVLCYSTNGEGWIDKCNFMNGTAHGGAHRLMLAVLRFHIGFVIAMEIRKYCSNEKCNT